MKQFIKVLNQQWLKYKPPSSRDIRQTNQTKFWSREAAEKEREQRIAILRKGSKADRFLASQLLAARTHEPAPTMCCPLAARRFQLFFVARAMKIWKQQGDHPIALTVFDPKWAVPFSKARTINWRKLHSQLRRRLERHLGQHVLVFGIGEIEADDSRQVWQPHYHLVVFGASPTDLKALRKKYFAVMADGTRPMLIKALRDAGWCSYASKLIAFRKVKTVGREGGRHVQRRRLKNTQFRQFMRYQARREPTSLIFSMNCSIVKKTRRA